ncbi:MAG TPA: glutamate-ammonia-ligase adenylyltransferase, partial [Spirochaetia bacterium]|nr:glutamate-ammonia-ligase adenylyltransferase [Spirochaetia bacterium]
MGINPPDAAALAAFAPHAPERFILDHLRFLDSSYFTAFTREEIGTHIRELAELTPSEPVRVMILPGFHGVVEVTVFTFDVESLFSLITGLLSQSGFNILQGDVFTYQKAIPIVSRTSASSTSPGNKAGARHRFVIDRFVGVVTGDEDFTSWSAGLSHVLQEILSPLFLETPPPLDRVKQRVNEMAARSLDTLPPPPSPRLLPIGIDIVDNDDGDTDADRHGLTHIHLTSRDTRFFLYALSSALSLNGVIIHRVHIDTVSGQATDDFFLSNKRGEKLTDPVVLDRVRFSILLTKQFTFFLSSSPHPYNALVRFESIIRDLVVEKDRRHWTTLLGNPTILRELAMVLGASDFLWEDFIRGQYESFFSLLTPDREKTISNVDREDMARRLSTKLAALSDPDTKIAFLNEFKNREIFRIDLRHILEPGLGFSHLAEDLTDLAELIVAEAFAIAYGNAAARHGRPLSPAGVETPYALFGLGKFGGRALGYASDIEFLFVYSDEGLTNGVPQVSNLEFFSGVVRETTLIIHAKREGIFRIDTRLRPFGTDGPLAVPVKSFLDYYKKGGRAHSAERLALTRLRAFAGDASFGTRIEHLRDELLYETDAVDAHEVIALRKRQYEVKSAPGQVNAKFSPGALVDLEYAVELLQIRFGYAHRSLRTPFLVRALEALSELGVIPKPESERLHAAYYFFRTLINGLRMLRGSAEDLFLPPDDSPELLHLARRIGYRPKGDLHAQQQLMGDFHYHTAAVRLFLQNFFGREFVAQSGRKNLSDLLLSGDIPEKTAR